MIIKKVIKEELELVGSIHPYPDLFNKPFKLNSDLQVIVQGLCETHMKKLEMDLNFADPLHALSQNMRDRNDGKPMDLHKDFPQVRDVPVAVAPKSKHTNRDKYEFSVCREHFPNPAAASILMLRLSGGGQDELVRGGGGWVAASTSSSSWTACRRGRRRAWRC